VVGMVVEKICGVAMPSKLSGAGLLWKLTTARTRGRWNQREYQFRCRIPTGNSHCVHVNGGTSSAINRWHSPLILVSLLQLPTCIDIKCRRFTSQHDIKCAPRSYCDLQTPASLTHSSRGRRSTLAFSPWPVSAQTSQVLRARSRC
jgi:hypothetical protein